MVDMDIFALCAAGDSKKLQELLEVEKENLHLEETNNDGKTPLEVACTFGRLPIIEVLVQFGANVKAISERGYTLAHWAATWGSLDVLKYLLNSGVDLLGKNMHGETVCDVARRYDQKECLLFLLKEEAMVLLKRRAQEIKEMINDPEKNMGRLDKNDKNIANKSCDEKSSWVDQNRENGTLEQVQTKSVELENQVKPILIKLEA